MNKRERFFAAVAGAPVDRPPLSVWMHFATAYMTGQEAAERHCNFFSTVRLGFGQGSQRLPTSVS